MGLLDRLQPQNQSGNDNGTSVSLFHATPQAHNAIASTDQTLLFEGLKARVQDELLEKMDLSKLDEIGYGTVLSEITKVINTLIAADGILITDTDRRSLIEATINDMLGLGPLEPLLQDNEISDILVNGPEAVWVERKGILDRTDISFRDEAHLLSIINRIASRVGRRIDESSPMVDARLPDGSRINAVIRPLAIDGPGLSIRRFGGHHFHIEDFVRNKTLTAEMAEFLHAAVITRLNILVSGGTGSGKTTLLNCLSTYLPSNQRIVTIEDAAELALQQPHSFRLESRPPNVEGKGEVTIRDLFRNTLRMRPDRVIVGEVRGGEVLDMLQAMSTGHDGSMATIHANNPRDSLGRLEMMVLLSGIALPERAMRQYIAGAVNMIVQIARLSDGTRRVVKITEITGMEGDSILTQDIFEFVMSGISSAGKVQGQFRPTKTRSFYLDRMSTTGIALPPQMFQKTIEV